MSNDIADNNQARTVCMWKKFKAKLVAKKNTENYSSTINENNDNNNKNNEESA